MTRWEYYVSECVDYPGAELSRMGVEGWELVCIHHAQSESFNHAMWHCVFKRPLPFPWWHLLLVALKGPFA